MSEQGRVVLITGAGGQVGSAVARRLVGQAPLALFARSSSVADADAANQVAVFDGVDASAYGAAKGALLRFAEALADEVAPHGVGVRVIAPTTIDTPANRAAMPKARVSDWVTPDEIASTVPFLLDPASSGVRFAAIPMGR